MTRAAWGLQAGDFLRARSEGKPIATPAEGLQGLPLAAALELQAQHVRAVLAHYGGEVIGFKLGGTDLQALAAMGLTGPLRGPILSAFTHASPARLRRADFFVCAVEAEIAVRLGKDIGGGPDVPGRAALVDAIDAVMPAIEIADSRYTEYAVAPATAILADAGFAGSFVQGAEAAGWATLDLPALPVALCVNGTEVRSGSGARVMGDPLQALGYLVADLGRAGEKLRAGQLVSTGACTPPYLAQAGDHVVADFGPLGRVELWLE